MTLTDSIFTDDETLLFQPAPSIAHVHNLYVLPAAREIYLSEEIEEKTGMYFVRTLRWLETRPDAGPADPVRIVLNTPGGDVESMFAIHDAIRSTSCPVEIFALGSVCSAGVLLLACGDLRRVTENLTLMSHESRGYEGGDLGFKASKDRRKFHDWQHNRWCELMARYTPQDASWWKRKTLNTAEYWLLGGAEIVEAGLADEIVSDWPLGLPSGFQKRDYKDENSRVAAILG